MNASLVQNRVWMLRSCSNLLPVESPVVKAALHAWQEIDLSTQLASSLRTIYLNLADAKRMAMPIVRDAGVFTAPVISPLKLQQMAALWRKLSEECETAVQALEPEARWRLSGLYTENSFILGRFLREAVSGLHTCVNQVGEVAVPVLPQRRRTQRYVLLQPCMVRSQNGGTVAVARDISRNGIGLSCEQDFQLKERVTIELRDGRKMRGVVAWARNKQMNVQFDEQLSGSDSLFRS